MLILVDCVDSDNPDPNLTPWLIAKIPTRYLNVQQTRAGTSISRSFQACTRNAIAKWKHLTLQNMLVERMVWRNDLFQTRKRSSNNLGKVPCVTIVSDPAIYTLQIHNEDKQIFRGYIQETFIVGLCKYKIWMRFRNQL